MTLPDDGPGAPPMQNGELVFDAPWQGRVFGMAESLADAGVFQWGDFQAALIEVIGEWRPEEAAYEYYDHFLEALERTLARAGVVETGALNARAEELAERLAALPHGHDHA